MKTSATVGMMTLMALAAQPGESRQKKTTHETITVCVEAIVQTGSAEAVASEIFAGIGIRIDWRHGRCPADALIVTLTVNTPASMLPGSLAYALPYEGSHIRIFYDRVADSMRYHRPTLFLPKVLGHVMAHEIGHMIQGISQHAETGVMKANWTAADYAAMTFKPLRFTPADIELIERGLAKRAAAPK